MAQTVFRSNQINKIDGEMMFTLPRPFTTVVEEPEEKEPEYTGPTVEDLKREAEEFKVKWEAEKAEMLANANNEAAQIIQKAQDTAFEEIKHQSDEASVIKNGAKEEASSIIEDAKKQAEKICLSAN